MKLKIEQKEEKITIGFAKKTISINLENKDNNPEWKTDKINEFLIDLSSVVDEGDEITLETTPLENDKHREVFDHVVKMFKMFVDEFNAGNKKTI